MANNHQDMTGVLKLSKVTPVILALFGNFDLDSKSPGQGQAYIAKTSESSSTDWSQVQQDLDALAKELDVKMIIGDDHEEVTIEDLIDSLAHHFGAQENESLCALLESSHFTGEADLDSLFVLACAFDDGHGLVGIKTESAWYCDRPRLFEFGGHGSYIGLHATIGFNSGDATMLGESVDEALIANDLALAAQKITQHVNSILAGVEDRSKRDALAALVAQGVVKT